MTIAIVDDELETRQYMQGLVAQYLAETGRMAQLLRARVVIVRKGIPLG